MKKFDNSGYDKLSDSQKELISKIQDLAKTYLADDYEGFNEFMDRTLLTITYSRKNTEFDFALDVTAKDELIDFGFSTIIGRILSFCPENQRLEILTDAMKFADTSGPSEWKSDEDEE